MSKTLIFGAIGLVGALAIHTFVNPMYAASKVQDAVKNKDGDKLVEMIDFPALREDLKADFAEAMEKETDPFARGLGGAMMSGMIDGFVQPEGLAQMVNGGRASKTTPAAEALKDYSTSFGLTEFIVTLDTDNGPVEVVFAPRGLTWKIVGANLDMSKLTSGM